MDRELFKRAGINDRARRIRARGRSALVPLKFDQAGHPATQDTLIIKRLSLDDLRFLAALRKNEWDLARSAADVGMDAEAAKRRYKRLAVFREEDARIKALAEIPTPEWLAAKHVENIYDGGKVNDSQHKSFSELAKIGGAYKQSAPTSQMNVFNITLTSEQEAQLKPVFDTIALEKSA